MPSTPAISRERGRGVGGMWVDDHVQILRRPGQTVDRARERACDHEGQTGPRYTDDLDVLVEPTKANARRLPRVARTCPPRTTKRTRWSSRQHKNSLKSG